VGAETVSGSAECQGIPSAETSLARSFSTACGPRAAWLSSWASARSSARSLARPVLPRAPRAAGRGGPPPSALRRRGRGGTARRSPRGSRPRR